MAVFVLGRWSEIVSQDSEEASTMRERSESEARSERERIEHDVSRRSMRAFTGATPGAASSASVFPIIIVARQTRHVLRSGAWCLFLPPHTALCPPPPLGIIAHGCSQLMQERMFLNSDAYRVHVCDKCGLFAIANLNASLFECRACKSSAVSAVLLPYAMKLLIQELTSMQIAPRLFVRG